MKDQNDSWDAESAAAAKRHDRALTEIVDALELTDAEIMRVMRRQVREAGPKERPRRVDMHLVLLFSRRWDTKLLRAYLRDSLGWPNDEVEERLRRFLYDIDNDRTW